MDRITDLPAHIIEKILGDLPMADGARTCVLSKKWRHRWEEAPQLMFDRNFVADLQKRRGQISESGIMKTILYEVLLAHSGLVNKFTLSIPQLESCPEIDRIIRFLAKKGVQDFKLTMLSGGFHKLPSHMFLYEHLHTFKLYSCIFEIPSTFFGFNKLVNLDFQKVVIDPNFFSMFISKSPQLERLVLNGCICDEPCSININASSLTHFNYTGAYKSVCFTNAPLLQVVSIYNSSGETLQSYPEKLCYLDEMIDRVPMIRFLSIDNYFLKGINVSCKSRILPVELNHLRILEAFDICLSERKEMENLFGLIRNSPNLEILKFEMTPSPESAENSIPHQEICNDWILPENKILKVSFLGFGGSDVEMELIKLLLLKLPVLKIMYVQPPAMEDYEQLKVARKILRFRRASSAVEILYGD